MVTYLLLIIQGNSLSLFRIFGNKAEVLIIESKNNGGSRFRAPQLQ